MDGKGGMVEKDRYLGWFILCVNLTGLRDAQTAGKTLPLGVMSGCFQKKLIFLSVD